MRTKLSGRTGLPIAKSPAPSTQDVQRQRLGHMINASKQNRKRAGTLTKVSLPVINLRNLEDFDD